MIRDDERIIAANEQAHALLGQGLVGRHFITALRQPDLLDAIEASKQDGAAREADYLATSGDQDITFEVSIRPVELSDLRGIMLFFADTTPMEQAGQIRREFVTNVSHELRTPLTALLGFIETLRGPAAKQPETQERFLGIMEAEAMRMNRLVDDLLSLSRVEAEARVRPNDSVELVDLVRSSLHSLTPLAERAGVHLSQEIPDAPVIIRGDADQLRQVVINLTENAIKYSGQGTSVTLSLRPDEYEPQLREQGVRFCVTDTGPGIESHHIPRLTERFYRVDRHRSREQGGTGLGLAIVKHIVNRHRGRLRIDSGHGQGSVFTVILPVE
ncbi:unnamed protein product [Cyprideis torosa]|uniref:histidine kinase n=1 Tax=Cyprideis torosa TaxID=163714 RepID=A0A7R8WTR4_9CRUS|nr:unnamed protein product [Cyprideis torosa]CAG0910206.1 unnamed protein product [Cyprideis torosa]